MNYGKGYQKFYQYLNNSPSPDGAFWLSLLEKAFAKLNVNYTNINGGVASEALRLMTGKPAVDYNTKDFTAAEIWDLIEDGVKNEYPMVAGSMTNPAFNTVPGHAETILGTVKLSNGQKLMKMRNPWGSYKYSGPYSAKSSLWTP